MPLSVSDKAKAAFLALFDEPTPTPSNSTKTKKELKNEFEARIGYKTPTSEIAAKIEAANNAVWIPHCYVLFVRVSTCKNCGASERVLDIPRLFLQSRAQRRDESNPYVYRPVREIEFATLPRRTVVNPTTTPFCLSCFEGVKCPSSSPSPEDVTELRIEDLETRAQELSENLQSPLPEATPSPSSPSESQSNVITLPAASGGSPSETEFGSACGEREFAPRVTAEG